VTNDLERILVRGQAKLAALEEAAREAYRLRRLAVRYLYQWHRAGR
jgi:hypothetical protein